MNSLQDILVKLRIFDPDHTLSLTSLMMMVLIAKVALSPSLDLGTISALFLSLLSYNGKKLLAHHKSKQTIQDTDKLAKLEAEVKSLASSLSLKNLSGR